MNDFSSGTLESWTGYLRMRPNTSFLPLTTVRSIDQELWDLLEFYSEIEEAGCELIKKNGISNKRQIMAIFKKFNSFVRQAKTYYNSTGNLHYRSSSLLYYYCFLNLVKAYLVINKPSVIIGRNKILHGLSANYKSNKFINHSVTLQEDEVFGNFYEMLTKTPAKKRTVSVKSCFEYCPEVSYQLGISGYGLSRISKGELAIIVNQTAHSAALLIAITGINNLKGFRKSLESAYKSFKYVEVPKDKAAKIFGIDASLMVHYKFLQSEPLNYTGESIPVLALITSFNNVFESILEPNYFDDEFDFKFSPPYRLHNQFRMKEIVAAYILMYYFSNLVRYKPDFLEGLLLKKEGWFIQSFMDTYPKVFLRMMIPLITNKDFVLQAH
jgi:hypothetical protein